jgi:hypothetical protein
MAQGTNPSARAIARQVVESSPPLYKTTAFFAIMDLDGGLRAKG